MGAGEGTRQVARAVHTRHVACGWRARPAGHECGNIERRVQRGINRRATLLSPGETGPWHRGSACCGGSGHANMGVSMTSAKYVTPGGGACTTVNTR